MGRLGVVLSSVFSLKRLAKVTRIKTDTGAGASKLNDQYGPVGEDARPLPGDLCYLAVTEKQGGYAITGFLDPNNEQKAEPGEKRTYARDDSGAVVVEFWLKKDGSAVLSNVNGEISLAADGTGKIENANAEFEVSSAGDITAQNSAGGSFELAAAGIATINTVIIDLGGNIVTGGSVTASSFIGGSAAIAAVSAGSISIGGVDLPANHDHNYSWTNAGGSGVTDPPNP